MSFLPIVARELRVTARKRSTYWIRFASAALALGIFGWTFLFIAQMGAGNMAGRMLFGGSMGLAWLYAVLGGIFKTADALSEEKRDGTLGLLFLTDLKGYDIVLGKIVASSVNWFFGLIALFPIFAVALLMGGVAPGEFWRKILGLTNLLFYSLALGMFVSSFMRNERRAAGVTILLLGLLLWLPGEMAEEHKRMTGALEPSRWLVLPDVRSPLRHGEDFLFNRNPVVFWQSLGVSHLVAWFYLLLASLIVPRTWQQPAGRAARWQEKAGQFAYGWNKPHRARFRERALGINPFYWLASRARGESALVYLVILVVCGSYLVSFFLQPTDWTQSGTYCWAAILLHGIIKVWVALAACRRFVEDRRSGALELVLSTPLSPGEIIRGQWRALARHFAGPMVLVLMADLVLLLGLLDLPRVSNVKDQIFYLFMFAAGATVFLADVVALGWLSMWRGMKARHSYGAWLWSMIQVLVLPWVVFYVGVTLLFVVLFMPRLVGGATATPGWMEWLSHLMLGLWFLVSMATAVLTIWWARHCLMRHFRIQATMAFGRPEQAPPTILKTQRL